MKAFSENKEGKTWGVGQVVEIFRSPGYWLMGWRKMTPLRRAEPTEEGKELSRVACCSDKERASSLWVWPYTSALLLSLSLGYTAIQLPAGSIYISA